MSAKAPPYPIVPDDDEKKQLDEWLSIVRKNEPQVKETWWLIYQRMSSPSLTQVPRSSFSEGVWGSEEAAFKPLMDHIIRAVLLVAKRFKWPPEEILALWQIEGLPCWTGVAPKCQAQGNIEREDWSRILLLSDWGLEPKNPEEARAFARSIVLWDRWGLDLLVPTIRREYIDRKTGEKKRDNFIDTKKDKEGHDEAFKKGFKEEISPILSESPFDYLTLPADAEPIPGPIAAGKILGPWMFRTHSRYQTTMLAMQYAHFKYLESVIQEKYGERPIRRRRKVKLELKPPFPTLVRTFFNCGEWRARETIILAMEDLVIQDLSRAKVRSLRKETYNSDDLEKLFSTMPVPKRISKFIRTTRRGPKYYGLGLCYQGGLRFEVLRQTYKDLFANTL